MPERRTLKNQLRSRPSSWKFVLIFSGSSPVASGSDRMAGRQDAKTHSQLKLSEISTKCGRVWGTDASGKP